MNTSDEKSISTFLIYGNTISIEDIMHYLIDNHAYYSRTTHVKYLSSDGKLSLVDFFKKHYNELDYIKDFSVLNDINYKFFIDELLLESHGVVIIFNSKAERDDEIIVGVVSQSMSNDSDNYIKINNKLLFHDDNKYKEWKESNQYFSELDKGTLIIYNHLK